MKNDFVIAAVGSLIFLVVLFVIGREIVCWYLKINIRLSVLIEIRDLLKGNTKQDQIKSVVNNQQSQEINIHTENTNSTRSNNDRYEPSLVRSDSPTDPYSSNVIKKDDQLDSVTQMKITTSSKKNNNLKVIVAFVLLSLICSSAYIYFFKRDLIIQTLSNTSVLDVHSDWFGSWDCKDKSDMQIYPHSVLISESHKDGSRVWNYHKIVKEKERSKYYSSAFFQSHRFTKNGLLDKHIESHNIPYGYIINGNDLMESKEIIGSLKKDNIEILALSGGNHGGPIFLLNEGKLFLIEMPHGYDISYVRPACVRTPQTKFIRLIGNREVTYSNGGSDDIYKDNGEIVTLADRKKIILKKIN